MASVIGYGESLDTRRYIGQTDISDGSFCLADRLDNGTGGRHGKAARHIIFVFQYAFLEKFVSSGRCFTGVHYYFAVVSAHLFPVGDLSTENVFQLLAGKLFHRIGRMYHYGKSIIGYNDFV